MTQLRTGNLLGEPEPTYLPADPAPAAALGSGEPPEEVAARYPSSSLAWAVLAENALAGEDRAATVRGYAFARTGYHRGLDALRRSGWRGQGPVPWSHEPNQGFLRSLHALGRAAARIGEQPEVERIRQFLADADPAVLDALGPVTAEPSNPA